MMHGYISKKDLNSLILQGRQAYIFCGIKTKDIDEYINGITNIMRSKGIDINNFNQPKIFTENGYTYILFLVAKSAHPGPDFYRALGSLSKEMYNFRTLEYYVANSGMSVKWKLHTPVKR